MSTLSPRGQDLVRAGRRAYQPTDADRDRLLGQLRAQLGDAALPVGAGTAAPSAAAAASSVWPVISAVVVGVGILGGALFHAWPTKQAHAPTPQARPAPAVVTAPTSEPAAPAPVPPAPASAATSPVVDQAAPASSGLRSKDRLAEEVALLSRATRDLRAGRSAEALKSLDEYRRKFPRGMLKAEYRAASAQALCGLGRFDEANATLRELPPQSPLVVRAKEFCAGKVPAAR